MTAHTEPERSRTNQLTSDSGKCATSSPVTKKQRETEEARKKRKRGGKGLKVQEHPGASQEAARGLV